MLGFPFELATLDAISRLKYAGHGSAITPTFKRGFGAPARRGGAHPDRLFHGRKKETVEGRRVGCAAGLSADTSYHVSFTQSWVHGVIA